MLPQEAHSGVWLLKDIDSPTALLGCGSCLDRQACGGLHLPKEGLHNPGARGPM